MKVFAEKLKNLRKERGLTQVDLANALGKSNTTISHYEAGKIEPSLEDIVKLAELLSCSTDYLLLDKIEESERELFRKSKVEETVEYLKHLVNTQAETIKHLLAVGKRKAYLTNQRVYNLNTLLVTPGLN